MASLVDFPQAREAPADLVRRLRALDPTTDLIYAGDGRWWLGRVRPNSERRAEAFKILERASNLPVGATLNARSKERVRLALLAYQGFAIAETYEMQGEPDGRIVRDWQRALWSLEHMTDDDLFDAMDAEKRAAKDAAHRDLTDPARAADAWRYAFTRSHSVTRWDDPTKPAYKSGRTRHPIHRVAGAPSHAA